MRSAVISFRYRLVPAFVLVLVVGLLPLVGALPAASADEADAEAMPLVAASQLVCEVSLQPLSEGGSGVPLVADALAGQPTRFVNQGLPLPAPTEPPPERAPAQGCRLRLRPPRRGNLPMAPRARKPPSP